jgi:adenylate cyclase
MMTPKLQRYISQITPFGIIFFVFGLIYALLEKGLLGGLKYYPSTGLPYDFEVSLYFSFTMAGIGLGGLV